MESRRWLPIAFAVLLGISGLWFPIGGQAPIGRGANLPHGAGGGPHFTPVSTTPSGGPFPPALAPTATVPTGSEPYLEAYDSGKGEVFVANQNANNVSVISDESNSLVATVRVGPGPTGIAYDAANGDVYVANWGADNVSVISDATNSVVASIVVGVAPYAVAYDPAKGEIFVTSVGCHVGISCHWGNVSVISGSTNTVVATTQVGNTPYFIAYDPGAGEIFVSNQQSKNVSILSDSTNQVVKAVRVGSGPQSITYDSSSGELFVANDGSNNISIISDASNSVVATIGVGSGSGPQYGTYDSSTGEVYIADCCDPGITVINGATNGIVGTLNSAGENAGLAYDATTGDVYSASEILNPGQIYEWAGGSNNLLAIYDVGLAPGQVIYDPGAGEMFITNYDSSNVSIIADSTRAAITSFVATPASGPIGTSFTLSVTTSGGTGTASYQYVGLPSGCVSKDAATLSCVPTSVGAYTVRVFVNVSGGPSGSAMTPLLVTPMVISSFAAVPATIAVGNSTVFSTTESGGVGVVTFAYSGLPPSCSSSNTATLTCAPSAVGTFSVRVYANDSVGDSATSTLDLTVTAMVVATFVATPASIQLGQTSALSSVVYGGAGAITYSYTGLPYGCSSVDANPLGCSPSEIGSYTLRVYANDSGGDSATATTALDVLAPAPPRYSVTFLVNPSACSPVSFNGTLLDSGTTVQFLRGSFTVHALPCPDAYFLTGVFRGDTGAVQDLTSPWGNVTITSDGMLWVNYSAMPIHETLKFGVTPSVCGPITFNGTAQANGTSAQFVAYGFYGALAPTCPNHSFVEFSLLSVSEGRDSWVNSSQPDLEVGVTGNATLTAIYWANPPPPLVAFANATYVSGGTGCSTGGTSQIESLSGVARGGSAPYTWSWTFGDGSAPVLSQNASHTYTADGPFVAELRVNDSRGQHAFANTSTITIETTSCVVPGHPLLSILGLDTYTSIVLIAVVAIVAVLAVLLLLRRRKGSDSPTSSTGAPRPVPSEGSPTSQSEAPTGEPIPDTPQGPACSGEGNDPQGQG